MMRCPIVSWGACVFFVAILAAAVKVRAQDGNGLMQSYPSTDQAPAIQPSGNLQPLAYAQPKTEQQSPPDYGALPPSEDYSNADLAKRVADLEKQLAKFTKAAEAAKSQPPTKPVVAPSGRIQFDVANFTQDHTSVAQFGDIPNAVGFRRARIALLGEYEVFDYIIEMDFANRGVNAEVNSKDQSTGFKDVYIQVRDLPVLGNVRVGHFKEPFGLEQLTSDNYTTFMERSIDDEGAFVPGRNNGIMAYSWTENQRATWSIGTFTNATGFDQPPTFQFDHWGLDLTMRATYLPWYDEPSGGRGYLHTGIDYAFRSAPDNFMILATRPESAFAPSVVNINKMPNVNNWQVLGTEAALVYGPFSIQSEFFAATVDRFNGLSNNFYGAYAFVSYFLTGENRPYNRKLGVFDRVRPYEDFFHVKTCDGNIATGRGAWEIAYRFSYIDMLDDLTIKGAGRAADHTFGLNWYMNPFAKVMFNYVHSTDTYNVSNVQQISGGDIDAFMVRFAMDF